MDVEGEGFNWMSNMIDGHSAVYRTVTLTSGDMAVEMVLLASYILMTGSLPQLGFRRRP